MAYTTIKKSSDYFNTKLYTGNGSTQSITGVGFQPDWTWVKERSSTSSHQIIDAVRGYNKRLFSNTTDAEAVDSSPYNDFKSIDSDGFTIGSGGGVNENSQTYASWNWLGANGTAANTDGSISSTVSANTTSGFSVVSWTGNGSNATIGHGLNSAPKVVIIKSRDSSASWFLGHESLGWNKYMTLENTNGENTDIIWNNTAPTSSVFSVGNYSSTNGSGVKFIGYCFADVQGFSKFGKYKGTSSTDGAFIYTGFKPSFFMAKCIDGAENWYIFDNKREGYNPDNNSLYADVTTIEGSTDWLDFLSNGVKFRYNSVGLNGSSNNYIYMAFAEQPLVGDNPATAR